jgi:hypothetical protein
MKLNNTSLSVFKPARAWHIRLRVLLELKAEIAAWSPPRVVIASSRMLSKSLTAVRIVEHSFWLIGGVTWRNRWVQHGSEQRTLHNKRRTCASEIVVWMESSTTDIDERMAYSTSTPAIQPLIKKRVLRSGIDFPLRSGSCALHYRKLALEQ